MIRVQAEDFDVGVEIAKLTKQFPGAGGVVAFVGLVRDLAGGENIASMTLEHYPGMTERALERIEAEAKARWPLTASLIIHRYGKLDAGEQIVLVVTASAHRQVAFDSCQFLIDWLKTKAPFWKSEDVGGRERWVEAKAEDDAATARWITSKEG